MGTITESKIERFNPNPEELTTGLDGWAVNGLHHWMDLAARPVVLVGRDGQVLHANPPAARLIGRNEALRLDRGKLIAALPHVTADLHRKIGLAIDEPDTSLGGAGILVMALPSPDGMPPLLASVMSLHSAHPLLTGVTVTAAALWLDDPMEDVDPPADALRTWFGLTPAETRVAIDLTNGFSPKEIAAKHGRHIRTVRTQIESVFGKLGVCRATQLVRVITRVSDLARRGITVLVAGALEMLGLVPCAALAILLA